MKTKFKISLCILTAIVVIILGIGIGSVYISPSDSLSIISNKLFGVSLPNHISHSSVSILLKLRLPRTFLAFIVGSALAASGTVMQSVLKNPLASSYTLGVSSGASLGAAIIIVTGFSFPVLQVFTTPFVGLVFGLLTVYLAIKFSSKLDINMENNTIILVGMVFSLFINAILTLIVSMYKENITQLTLWQMGTFASKEWIHVGILLPIVIIGSIILIKYSKELDILTFGEEQALSIGVDVKKIKWILLGLSAALTGCAVSFVGVIGFIDLIAPHVVRKIFGSSHRLVLPMSMIFGGTFMIICDIVARTIISPSELSVGAVTALIGAPFFGYIYFSRRRG